MIDTYASLEHYAEHLAPVWAALPTRVRGRAWAPRSGCWWGEALGPGARGTHPVLVAGYADARRMAPRPVVYLEHGAGQTYSGDPRSAGHPSYSGGVGLGQAVLFIVPGEAVAARWRATYPDTPVAVVGCPRLDRHHVVDGSYYGDMTTNCSVEGCGGAVFARGWCVKHYTRWRSHGDPLVTMRPEIGEPAAVRFWRYVDKDGPVSVERPDLGPCWLWTGGTIKGYGEFWDGAQVYAHRWSYEHHVGPIPAKHDVDHLCCQPLCVRPTHLEPVTHGENMRRMWRRKRRGLPPVVAMTWHWDNELVAESRSALVHYRRSLVGLRDAVRAAGGELWGHGHPRAWASLSRVWRTLGVPLVPSFDDVAAGASVLVGDNTSALYEFASLGRPVVVLNAPWYRRDVEHGLRFWTHVPGEQVDRPEELVPAVLRALADPTHLTPIRERAVHAVYAHADGRAAERAAAAIVEVLDAQVR